MRLIDETSALEGMLCIPSAMDSTAGSSARLARWISMEWRTSSTGTESTSWQAVRTLAHRRPAEAATTTPSERTARLRWNLKPTAGGDSGGPVLVQLGGDGCMVSSLEEQTNLLWRHRGGLGPRSTVMTSGPGRRVRYPRSGACCLPMACVSIQR